MADQSERPEPDVTEDPRKTAASEQMPEEAPDEQVPGESGARGGGETDRAPATSHPEESDAGASTGNPGAAGA